MRTLRPSTLFLAIVFLTQGEVGTANQKQKPQFFVAPREAWFPVTVHQPDCPLEFVSIMLLGGVEGGGTDLVQIRNRGVKAIRSYTVAMVEMPGGGYAQWTIGAKTDSEILQPGQTTPLINRNAVEIVPLTDEMREHRHIGKGMRAIFFFMVVRAEFADGSVFEAAQEYKAMHNFIFSDAMCK